MSKKFQKNKEDFVCKHCGKKVIGNGYTNHCPKCLWSKHVDVNPGDREATCQGVMKPVRVEAKGGEYLLVNRCEKCGHEKKNRLSPEDNFDEAMRITKAAADKVLDKGK